ncbi:hypothetical protein PHYBOEH_005442 [Phytophthora boehmeriae]|uniref:PHD-type domain-containing protein n=1 Tax=Phytophthora boehmeriae TaxID=109152 RepID=A0A8T1WQN6_9STRA|nr:hypothetical protein PHYBOEH_005442 [Phytophthora boehmeriae]
MAAKSSLVPASCAASRGPASCLASPARPFRVGSDGLPLLPCHEASCRTSQPLPSGPAQVELFGHVDSAQDVRRMLQDTYHHSSEMTLRIDTELELLRRRCFAQRNAQWGDLKPDQFAFVPVPNTNWTPLQAKQDKSDGQVEVGKDAPATVDEYVRDRAWPPQEFALKPLVKPKGKAGRRKAVPMAAVLDPVPVLAKTCKECRTQSTPLWRTQTRQVKVTRPKASAAVAGVTPAKMEMEQVLQPIQVDLCLKCFLKLERKELFDRKLIDKKKQDRKRKEQIAAAALLEKKRLRQQIQVLKKQDATTAQAANHVAGDFVKEEEQVAKVILKFTREEIQAATGFSKDRKKDRKHSRKDKKKKKKRRHKHEHVEGSESEGPPPMPSPPQMDGYVYADRELETYTTPSTSVFHQEPTTQQEEVFTNVTSSQSAVGLEDAKIKEEAMESVRSSSRKRKTVSRTSPAKSVESPASASKKQKTSAARTSRPKRVAASATAVPVPAPAAVAAPLVPIVRKRPRTKKELARERELRALGQYCPVCNEVYEDDDQNTFVCCDSCELWVHGACDPSLTPYVLLACLI